jgi:hypothetical protein
MSTETLTEFWRRVLGHLPVYAEDEAAHIEAEGGPEISIRAYSLPDFTTRLAEDPHCVFQDPETHQSRPLSEAEVEAALGVLVEKGNAKHTKDGWKMTKAGLEALTAPVDESVEQIPGAVTVGLDPAHADSKAIGA